MKVLVTYGGTTEPIDKVRFITNFSSGNTGYEIASYLQQQELNVSVVRAKNSRPFKGSINFFSHLDLQNYLREALSTNHFDAIIHAAAVSDYVIEDIRTDDNQIPKSIGGKFASGQNLKLSLKPSIKIVNQIREYSKNKDIKIIAFKLTDHASVSEKINAVKKLFESDCDYVVQNDLSQISESQHEGYIYDKKLETLGVFSTKTELSENIYKILKENL